MTNTEPASFATRLQQITARDIVVSTATVLGIALLFGLLLALRDVFILVFLGILLATALQPITRFLRRRGVSRTVAAWIALILVLAGVAGLVLLMTPVIFKQVQTLAVELPLFYQGQRAQLLNAPTALVRQFGAQLPEQLTAENAPLDRATVLANLPWLQYIGRSLFDVLAVIAFTFYWLLSRERTQRGLLLLVPLERRTYAEGLWDRIEAQIGAFLRGQFLLGLSVGVLSFIGYWLAGVPYAPLLAILAGLLELVPFIGPLLTTVIAVAAGLSIGTQTGVSALVVGLIVQQVENVLLVPRIMDHTVGISPMISLLAFVGFAAIFGTLGGLVAIPLAAVVQLLLADLAAAAQATATDPNATRRGLSRLRYQVRDLARDLTNYVRRREEHDTAAMGETEEQLEQVLSDLDSLLLRSDR